MKAKRYLSKVDNEWCVTTHYDDDTIDCTEDYYNTWFDAIRAILATWIR